MKNLLIISLLFFFYFNINAQNLVPNPSFEEHSKCPDSISQINIANGWFTGNISPDYYNGCYQPDTSGKSKLGVPDNYFGHQEARTGEAYAGAFVYGKGVIREVIGVKLTEPLIIGTRYYVNFYVNLADRRHKSIINKLGMVFSNTEYRFIFFQGNHVPIENQAKVYTDSIITDTDNWTKIEGSFISDSNYTHIYIGNFFSDSLVTTNFNEEGNPYFYIDDVCVSSDPSVCGTVPLSSSVAERETINIFPNPFSNDLKLSAQYNGSCEIILYNLSYVPVLRQTFNGSTQLITDQLSRGVYVYEIRNKNGLVKKGKVVKM